MLDDYDSPSDREFNGEPMRHVAKFSVVPSSPVERVKTFRERYADRMGELPDTLCQSCLGSGFVHAVRAGQLGVLSEFVRLDKQGDEVRRLVRCDCEVGRRKAAQSRR